ncbi:hypothetical protein OWR28_19875 [Chryseobacterium sp. 1B4]
MKFIIHHSSFIIHHSSLTTPSLALIAIVTPQQKPEREGLRWEVPARGVEMDSRMKLLKKLESWRAGESERESIRELEKVRIKRGI